MNWVLGLEEKQLTELIITGIMKEEMFAGPHRNSSKQIAEILGLRVEQNMEREADLENLRARQ